MLPPPINPTAMIQFAALWNWHRLQQTLDEKIYIRADRVAFVRPDRWEPWNDELHCERREASDGQMRRLASPSRLVRVPHRNMQAISFQPSTLDLIKVYLVLNATAGSKFATNCVSIFIYGLPFEQGASSPNSSRKIRHSRRSLKQKCNETVLEGMRRLNPFASSSAGPDVSHHPV
ncbi:hypothetical protein PGTUg99_028686 [Puccinia graminis f. sp. tritici]|uniref:Uncharacterized protein n=1 Tax=Puccinia graminis f. sp. tritici TaxID=56615 RepID=A0A5B0RZM4_PUCGR|nr:hypothetical protein PGTUg99_028686 [Puccinia graminis f. sp. tritici]